MNITNKFLATALLCASALTAQNPITHFWIDAAGGNDTNPGTQAQPFKSLTHAVLTQFADVHIHVMPGTYSPTTTGDFWDAANAAPAAINLVNYTNLTITGEDRNSCILDFGAGNGQWGFVKVNTGCIDVEISHLTMKNSGVDPWGCGALSIDNGCQGVDIHNCYFENTYSTLIIWGGYDVAFHDNVITDATTNTGAWPSVGVRVRTNAQKGDRTYIYNNTFHSIDQAISWSNDVNNPQQWICNNIAFNCGAKAFPNDKIAGAHIVVENNLAFGAGTWNFGPTIGPNGTAPALSATNIEVDPLLTSPATGDVSLMPGSPCIDAGSTTTHPYIMHDYMDNNRAVDSDEDGTATPEIGAIEVTDLSLNVTDFEQGKTAIVQIQTSSTTPWLGSALFLTYGSNPLYIPPYGIIGVDLSKILVNPTVAVPLTIPMAIPVNPALTGKTFYMQAVGVRVTGSGASFKMTGMTTHPL